MISVICVGSLFIKMRFPSLCVSEVWEFHLHLLIEENLVYFVNKALYFSLV